jgi:hypothetical protein
MRIICIREIYFDSVKCIEVAHSMEQRVLIEKLVVASLVKKFSIFVEPEGSLQYFSGSCP